MKQNKTKENALTHDRLSSLLEYNAESGAFRWLKKPHKRNHNIVGDIAGYNQKGGYIIIQIDKQRYFAHRVAWFYVYGVWPTDEIDHINGDKLNNSIENLREATASENKRWADDLRKTNTKG